nr:hypothetical protein [Cupriavidus gilardii]
MTVKRMDNVLIVVDALEAVKAFFVDLGLKPEGQTTVEGPAVSGLIGLGDVRSAGAAPSDGQLVSSFLLALIVMPLDGEEHARAEHENFKHDKDYREPIHHGSRSVLWICTHSAPNTLSRQSLPMTLVRQRLASQSPLAWRYIRPFRLA